MKITKYEKVKNNKYIIYLDNDEKISLYDEVILNNDLLLTKEINDINILLSENEYYEAYYDSIKYLNRKLRSTNELEKYLNNKYDNIIVLKVIDRLKKEKYLNDELFVNSYVHDNFILTNKGYYRIYKELEELGIDNEIINNSLDKITYEEWVEKLTKLINKKIKTNTNYSRNKLYNKMISYFIGLGYSSEMINNVLDNSKVDNDNGILNKTYQKLYNKLSKKYSGKELEFQLTNRLLKEGFNYDDIKNIINDN